MLKNLDYRIKNRLLLAGALLLLMLSWPLALRKTSDAIALNRQLSLKNEDKSNLSYNPAYLNQKGRVLEQLVSRYTLDSAGWKNELWLKASGAASAKGISVSYTPDLLKSLADTGSTKTLRQSISFGGDYRKLVALLDTLEKMEGVGFVSSAKFERVKNMNAEGGDKLHLKVVFGGGRK